MLVYLAEIIAGRTVLGPGRKLCTVSCVFPPQSSLKVTNDYVVTLTKQNKNEKHFGYGWTKRNVVGVETPQKGKKYVTKCISNAEWI